MAPSSSQYDPFELPPDDSSDAAVSAGELPEQSPAVPPRPADEPRGPRQFRSRRKLALTLFVVTCISTFLAGTNPGLGLAVPDSAVWGELSSEVKSQILRTWVSNGLIFSGALMLTLLAHEMGHYLQARRHHVPASLPYFIPFPISPFGTMGAVIVQGAGFADRKKLFDIAISGPLAGLVLALPITWFGLKQSGYFPIPESPNGPIYGDPLILQWMGQLIHGPKPAGHDLAITPLLFAGWVGIFITALNLIPIGQLDGGHVLYTLIGKRAHKVALLLMATAVGMMIYFRYPAYALMLLLLFLMGPKHPPTADDTVPLGAGRIILGWLTLAFVIVGFTPMPITNL